MPNWCSTKIWFYSEDKNSVEEFYTFVQESISEMRAPNGFGSDWLGNVLIYAGLENEIDGSLGCRGSIEYISDDIEYKEGYYYFDIDTETAWVPMIKMWVEVLKKQRLDHTIEIAYQAEECGCELYEQHDDTGGVFAVDTVYIDAFGDEAGKLSNYYADPEKAMESLREFFNAPPDTYMDELVEMAEKYSEENEYDNFIGIHIFNRAGLLDYD